MEILMPDTSEKPVFFVTQWFDPEPVMRGKRFAQLLSEHLGPVDVITGFPNYPGGKVYSGYKIKVWHKEQHTGFRLLRLPLYPSHDNRAIHRVANYISFAASVFFYCLFALRRTNVVYVYHPPLTVGLAVVMANLIHRKKVVIDIQDLWPDTLSATGMINSPKALKVIDWFCNWLYRRVSHIVVLSPGFKTILVDRGVPEDKITHVYNWAPDEGAQTQTHTQEPALRLPQERFNVVYAGNMGPAQGLLSMISAAKQCQDAGSSLHVSCIGAGLSVDQLKAAAKDAGLRNISFHPPVAHSEIGAIMDQADALLVSLNNDPLFTITIPSKLMSYLARGKPIVAALAGDARDLVKQNQAGLVADPENADQLARALMDMENLPEAERAMMGRRAHAFYQSDLSMHKGTQKIAEIILGQ